MNWKKAIGFGILIWLIMFALVSATLGWYDQLWFRIVLAIIAGIISLILAGYIKPSSYARALTYGVVFVVIGVILDLLVTRRFNAAIFSDWVLWLSYVLVLVAPMLRVQKKSTTTI
ncbi:MAG: hypothetical protein WCV92_04550 [Candidatus Buchananbacteria bacterium]